jgi:hypothetical protein
MKLHNSFRAYAIDSLKESDFLEVLMREHFTTLKRIKAAADKRMGHYPGSKGSSWKPHFREIIRQVASWPPREKVLGMPVHKYLEGSAINAIDENNGWPFLKEVPGSYFTPDFVLNCARRTDELATYLPSHIHTESFYYSLIRNDGLGLKAVPSGRITIPLCEEAVRQNGLALKYVPAHFQNGMVCMMAVENNPMALPFVPKSRMNQSLCMAAVRRDGMALAHVPYEMRTIQLCKLAFITDKRSSVHMPEEVKKALFEHQQKALSRSGLGF